MEASAQRVIQLVMPFLKVILLILGWIFLTVCQRSNKAKTLFSVAVRCDVDIQSGEFLQILRIEWNCQIIHL
jgi:hypothetical protein